MGLIIKKYVMCGIKYKDCKCCLGIATTKDGLIV